MEKGSFENGLEILDLCLADVSIFLFFLLFRGRGRGGGVRDETGRGVLLFGNQEGGRVSEEGKRCGAHRGWEGVAGRGGGWAEIVFWAHGPD